MPLVAVWSSVAAVENSPTVPQNDLVVSLLHIHPSNIRPHSQKQAGKNPKAETTQTSFMKDEGINKTHQLYQETHHSAITKVLVCFSVAVIKQWPKAPGGGRVYSTYSTVSVIQGKIGTWKQEMKRKPWRVLLTDWLAPQNLLSFLSYTIQCHLPMAAPPVVGWAPRIYQKCPHRNVHRPNGWRRLPSWHSLLPTMSSLYHEEKS